MRIIKTVAEMIELMAGDLKSLKTGFVPTMGALHAGHISLVDKSVKENDVTIVSIFVNPTQFNDKTDFENYPVSIDADLRMLQNANCDFVFMPHYEDVYQNYSGYKMDFEGLDNIYEGEFRPGHFQGVVDIVFRLFDIIAPTNSYFGEKDFQQLAIIKLMVKKAKLNLKLIPCEILREESGLAMSSRNERLSSTQRRIASEIYKTLDSVKNSVSIFSNPSQLILDITAKIDENEGLKTEYVVFCEPESLKSVNIFEKNTSVRLCIAVWCGKIRLIDNISLQF